ncbi:hypothetical protein TetV_502 [Tetraselmis virus 1]|uniref:Uncharacterized protein n=1 Tax=Tetraselmis virus 1 TaxID=2060617 RepID=A0A2P0VNU8_9VIRU|nr:hypothetical protein QJ968_gp552 [Tetraselmis virus 1]AUF82584.1 hypothetical protein TetV_502 [Tetraselmis virus 1]
MTISQVLLYVSETPTVPETATEDITAEWNYDNVITYIVGKAYALRYYWVKIVDNGSNETFYSLGSYRTQDNTDPVVSGSLSLGVPTTSRIVFNHSISDNSDNFSAVYALVTTDSGAKTFSDISTNGREIPWYSVNTNFDGLTENVTYYGWIAAEDAGGNQTVFSAGSITTEGDTVGPTLSSFTFTATVGLEETHVDISLVIDDDILSTPQYSSLTTVVSEFPNTNFTITDKKGWFVSLGSNTWRYDDYQPHSVWKADNGNVILSYGSAFRISEVTNGWDPYTSNDGDLYDTGSGLYYNKSGTTTDSVTGHVIPTSGTNFVYTLNPDQRWSQYLHLTVTGMSRSSLNTTYTLVYGVTGTFTPWGYGGLFNFYKAYTIWVNDDKSEFIGNSMGRWYAWRPTPAFDVETASYGDTFTVSGSSDTELIASKNVTDANTGEHIPEDSSYFNYN